MQKRKQDSNSLLFSLKQLKEIEISKGDSNTPEKDAAPKTRSRKFKLKHTDETGNILSSLLDSTSRDADAERRALEDTLRAKADDERQRKADEDTRRRVETSEKRRMEQARLQERLDKHESMVKEQDLKQKVASGEISKERFVKSKIATVPGFRVMPHAADQEKRRLPLIAAVCTAVILVGGTVGGYFVATSKKPAALLNSIESRSSLDRSAEILLARVDAKRTTESIIETAVALNSAAIAYDIDVVKKLKKKSEPPQVTSQNGKKRKRKKWRRKKKLSASVKRVTPNRITINTDIFKKSKRVVH